MLKLKLSRILPLPLILLTSCEVGPKYVRPKTNMPKLMKVEIEKFMTEHWWTIFDDSVLTQLEEKALKNNYDLKMAVERIEMAMADSDAAFGDLLPTVGAGAAGAKKRISETSNDYKIPGQPRSFRSYDAKLQASYELDFFGRYRSASDAARATLLSTKAARQVVLLTVTSQVAKTYFMVRALEAKLQIARRTLNTRQQTYNVYDNRYRSGYCTQLDFLRVKSELYSVKTAVLNLEKALSLAETSLSLLAGCSPREMQGWKLKDTRAIDRLKSDVAIPAGIPSDILSRRPDVVSAEGQLMAANAKIGEAMAAHFPSFSLTGALGFESKMLTSVFTPLSDTLQFGGGISLPLFAGGKIEAMTKKAKAAYRMQLANYQKTVQTAFKESLDALTEYHQDSEIVKSRKMQVEALRKSYSIASQQKNIGMIDLIDLLDVERGLLAAEIELVEAQFNKLSAIADVCRAFGGGWKYNPKRKHKNTVQTKKTKNIKTADETKNIKK